MRAFRENHVWSVARDVALRRDGGACVVPGCGSMERLEVNHIEPLAGRPRSESCMHHQDNLETLCHEHHLLATAAQRERGLF